MFKSLLLTLSLVLFSSVSFAENNILFEGYYQLFHDGQPIGWSVERFYFDNENKNYTQLSFTKAEYLGKNYSEKIRATASESFTPLSLHYEALESKNKKIIKATVTNNQINITTTTNSKNKKTTKNLKKGSFFSSFLKMMLLNNKIELNKKMNYQILLEETAKTLKGKSIATEKIKTKGQWTYKVYTQIADSSMTFYINKKGEILKAEQPQLHLSSILQKDLSSKIRQNLWSDSDLKNWFGNIPLGKINSLNKKGLK